MRVALVTVVLACAACTPTTARPARTAGKWMSIGGVIGMIGGATLATTTEYADEIVTGFSLVTGLGVALYATAELTAGPRYKQESIPERNRRWARMITEHAAGAAREGRCARVRKLEPRVRLYNAEIHDFVFMRDPEIQKCLTAPPTPPPKATPTTEDR
jgi:hypothetical protein